MRNHDPEAGKMLIGVIEDPLPGPSPAIAWGVDLSKVRVKGKVMLKAKGKVVLKAKGKVMLKERGLRQRWGPCLSSD